jgi:D-serine deaminase-like pyridoxal phosphate-dependent protein
VASRPEKPVGYDAAAVAALRREPLSARTKGIPANWSGATIEEIVATRPGLIDLPLPVVAIDAHALAHNVELMARWCADRGVLLCPHGKTTMAPQLFARQLDAGAWGITAATVGQAAVMRSVGIERILIANEVVDPVALRWIVAELSDHPELDLLCFADSAAGVALMTQGLDGAPRPVRVLLEIGRAGGRAGSRTREQSIAVAVAVAASPHLALAGVAAWDGAYGGDASPESLSSVDAVLRDVRDTVVELDRRGLFDGEVIVSAGGSAYFDRVVSAFTQPWHREVAIVLRSGAYITHDDAHYSRLSPFQRRGTDNEPFRPALHVYGRVLSTPEPGLAILDFGKRDVAYDIDLPVPQQILRSDGTVVDATACRISAVNDQHAFLRVADGTPVTVGDVVRCGLSHPCTVFDKWQLLPVVDGDVVVDLVRTFF